PVISTVLSLLPMTRRNSNTARIRALRPTTTESMLSATGVMGASDHAEVLELGDLLAQRGLDAQVERHVRARAPGAHAGELDGRRVAAQVHQLDVAAVGLQEGPYAIEHGFHPLPGDHESSVSGV